MTWQFVKLLRNNGNSMMSLSRCWRLCPIYTCRVHRIHNRLLICNTTCSCVYLCRVALGCTPNDPLLTPLRLSFDARFCMDPSQYKIVLSTIRGNQSYYPYPLKLLDNSGQVITTSLFSLEFASRESSQMLEKRKVN